MTKADAALLIVGSFLIVANIFLIGYAIEVGVLRF